ncbi:MAG TPA: MerR family transcriptional regulator [Firmicutes bacterium]|nr:MerR family transcriptional regulator [Bacillota bacterium]
MEYTVQRLASLAGVSTRTLRYYDEIGLLKPARINSSGYRIYGTAEVDRLQQIMFYRELVVGLSEIQQILEQPEFNALVALREHRLQLLAKRAQLDQLIANVEKTIAQTGGGRKMSDKEKFAGFKQKMIAENEAKYGAEVRAKYGSEAVERSNKLLANMTQEQFAALQDLSQQVMETLKAAFATGDPKGELAQKAADLHRQWLCFTWPSYSKEAHAGLARMYVEDERFKAHYDQDQPGLAQFLCDAILAYTGMEQPE